MTTTQFLDGPAGRIALHVFPGSGPPLVLVHSINAAASVAEVRPLVEAFRTSHTVVAPDLPGFGASERSDRAYTPRLYTDALHQVLDHACRMKGGAPVDALAVSLACEFLARAAVEKPASLRSLALVSPTGFNGTRSHRAAAGRTREVPGLGLLLRGPGWGGALYRQLTRQGVIRYFLERTFGSKQIDEQLWADAVRNARAPGAEHAPLAFLCAGLFSADIHDVYERIAQPVWMSHGVRGDFTDYRGKSIVEGKSNWRLRVFQAGAMPYFEEPEVFCAAYEKFLAAIG